MFIRQTYSRLSLFILYLMFLTGCAFISNNPADAAKNAASAGKTDDQIDTFKVIAQYPWIDGTIIAYEVESSSSLPNMQKMAVGFAAIDQGNRVLARSETLISQDPGMVDIDTDVAQIATNYPVTMISGKIYIDNIDKIEVVFTDNSSSSVIPIGNTYAIAVDTIIEPCRLKAYTNNKLVTAIDIPSITNTCQ